jgi:hypothetical protein
MKIGKGIKRICGCYIAVRRTSSSERIDGSIFMKDIPA